MVRSSSGSPRKAAAESATGNNKALQRRGRRRHRRVSILTLRRERRGCQSGRGEVPGERGIGRHRVHLSSAAQRRFILCANTATRVWWLATFYLRESL